jgi:5'-methylthioadenosine phosphorylase
MQVKIGIIGGSGFYQIEGLTDIKTIEIDTPFGKPSDALILGKLDEQLVVFLPRHAVGHPLLPSDINVRANIYALKSLGVEWIISVSAVGSLKQEIEPRHFVIPDQLYDHTKNRKLNHATSLYPINFTIILKTEYQPSWVMVLLPI